MKYFFTFLFTLTFAFSQQQVHSYKIEFQKNQLNLYLKFSHPINKDTIIQNKKNIEIKHIQNIRPIKKKYSSNQDEELLLYSKNNNLMVDLKTETPYKIDYEIQNNLVHLKYIFLPKKSGLDSQYFIVLFILCGLILALFFVKKSIATKQKNKALSIEHYFIDSKNKILSIYLNNTRYIVLITPKGATLLDRIITFDDET
ncbi:MULTISPECIES: hypothetical protein [unclassified Helicobacter]|uniref:hypothetical protein n=1 Tax=unclassified Helicobacter TaxID=2593540 RepID=UPI000CF03896|nr:MULTISPECIES: hypothetical protein [unclassified Helicobacter]